MSSGVAAVCLRAEHAIELGELVELVELVADWLAGASDVFADASAAFAGEACTVEDLRADVARSAFVLGGDGERSIFGGEW